MSGCPVVQCLNVQVPNCPVSKCPVSSCPVPSCLVTTWNSGRKDVFPCQNKGCLGWILGLPSKLQAANYRGVRASLNPKGEGKVLFIDSVHGNVVYIGK